jgi:hypothetical protein
LASHKWARSAHPELDIILAGTPERAAQAAGELCEHGPVLVKPYDHKIVLDRIKRLLAARARLACHCSDALIRDGIRRMKATGADVVLIDPQFAPKVTARASWFAY